MCAQLEGTSIAGGTRHPVSQRFAILCHRFLYCIRDELAESGGSKDRLGATDLASIRFHHVLGPGLWSHQSHRPYCGVPGCRTQPYPRSLRRKTPPAGNRCAAVISFVTASEDEGCRRSDHRELRLYT
jgi:hypothetical protein